MQISKLHVHSMISHVAAGLTPLGAAAWVLNVADVPIGGMDPAVWQILAVGCLTAVFIFSLPTTITGIGERNHMYAKWHRTHRLKLVLSLALTVVVGGELIALLGGISAGSVISWFGFLIVVVNNGLVFALVVLGLKITVGRLSIAGTSYTPDMFLDPVVDILEQNAVFASELPKNIDPLEEE